MDEPEKVKNKIAETVLTPKAAKGVVYISSDNMHAAIAITAPENGGADLSEKDIRELLKASNVCYGIDDKAITELAEKPTYGTRITVAAGTAPINGTDASLVFHIRKEKEFRPKELPDGSVDYRDLNLVDEVVAGSVLCVKTPAVEGIPGTNVRGQVVAAKQVKNVPLPAGKNTEVSEDGLTLLSSIVGQADYSNNKIHVLDTLTIKGDVSISTGDINFSGNVVVKGGVMSGYSIKADGSVDIAGFVEAAHISTESNLVIRGGFNGGGTGTINVAGNASLRYIQNGNVSVRGNLETTYIMTSNVRCGGSVNLFGKGLIIGGVTTAKTSLSANILGSASSTVLTQIEVGIDPIVLLRYYEIPKLLEKNERLVARLNVTVSTLHELMEAGRLTDDKKEILKKMIDSLSSLKQEKIDMELEREALQEQIAEMNSSYVRVQNAAYPGVRLTIGNAQLVLQNEYKYVMFTRGKDGITFAPIK